MMWKTIIHTIPEENLPELLDYCQQAAEQDETFLFEEWPDRIIVKSPTRTQAYRRGVLLHHKFHVYFEVTRETE